MLRGTRPFTVLLALAALAAAVAGCRPPVPPAAPSPAPSAPVACRRGCVTTFGAVLGESEGVEARSNCHSRCVDPTPATVAAGAREETYTGLRWQCVEYARRWWALRRGIVFASVDTADAMWSEIRRATHVRGGAPVVVQPLPDGGAAAPEVGDLLIYRASREDSRLRFGHVAVVVGVRPAARGAEGSLELAEQNFTNARWSEPAHHARRVRLVGRAGGWSVVDDAVTTGSPIRGWLRAGR